MLDIPAPPQPQLAAAMTFAVAGVVVVVVGGLLLVWGRLLSRAFLALTGAGVGALLAESLGRQFHLTTEAAGLLAIMGLAIVGALAARFIWAIAGGAIIAAVAVFVLLSYSLPALPAASQPAFGVSDNPEQWLRECWRFAQQGLIALWDKNSAQVLWTLCLAGGLPLATLLLAPRLGKIFMTALTGAVAVVVGLLLAVSHFTNLAWPKNWSGYTVYGVVALVLLVFSMVLQFCGEVAAWRAEKQKKEKEKEQQAAAAKARMQAAKPARQFGGRR